MSAHRDKHRELTTTPRRRHVKCDESKPACQRCIKWRGHCDGYEDLRSTSQTPKSTRSRARIPKSPETNKFKVLKWCCALVAESSKLVSQPQDVCVWDKASAEDYIVGSRTQTNKAKGFDETFWYSTVSYLLRQNQSVWYANLAIHALIDSKRPAWFEDIDGQSSESFLRALRYHGLALGYLSKEVITRSALRSATLCCLFFVVFETMNGDEKSAQAHMYNGCKMLIEMQKNSMGHVMSNAEVDATLHTELQKALRFVASQVNGPRPSIPLVDTPGDGTTGSFTGMTTASSVAIVKSSEGGGSAFSMDEIRFGPSQF